MGPVNPLLKVNNLFSPIINWIFFEAVAAYELHPLYSTLGGHAMDI